MRGRSSPSPRARRPSAVRRTPSAARAGAARRDPAADIDSSPSRYIARIDKRAGAEVAGEIDPADLLVSAHRDLHPAEVAAQFVASRLVGLTGREGAVEAAVRAANKVGSFAAKAAAVAAGRADVET